MQSRGSMNVTRFEYYQSLTSLLLDCLSGDPGRSLGCATANFAGSVCGCVLPLLVCLGLLGNATVAWVTLARMRPLTRQNAYFGCIAATDASTMTVHGALSGFLDRGLPWLTGGRLGFLLYNHGHYGCKSFLLAVGLCQLLPAAFMLVMVADRALSILAPFRFRGLGSGVAFKAMLAAAVASALLSTPVFVLSSQVSFNIGGGVALVSCYFPGDSSLPLLYWNLVCNPPTLTLASIALLNCALVCSTVRAARERNRLQLQQQGGDGGPAGASKQQGAATVMALSMVMLAFSMPPLALYWTMKLMTDAGDTALVRLLAEWLYIVKAMALASPASNFL